MAIFATWRIRHCSTQSEVQIMPNVKRDALPEQRVVCYIRGEKRSLPEGSPELLNKKQLADLLGVSLKTLDRWTQRGILPPPARLGRRLKRWRRIDIERWIEDNIERS